MKKKVLMLIFLLVPSLFSLSVNAYNENNSVQTNNRLKNLANLTQPTYTVNTQEIENNQAEPLSFKLLNLNILVGVRPEWKDVVKEESPDIAFLDETAFWQNSQDADFLAQLDEFNNYFTDEDPYFGAVIDEAGDNAGSAIISRFPIISSHQFINYPADDGTIKDFQRYFIDVVVDIDGVQVHVVGGHFKCCGDGIEKRIKTMEEMINYLDDLGDVPIIFTGDFNSDSPQDAGLVDRVFSNLGEEPLTMLLDSSHPKGPKVHNWTDMFRELNPHTPGTTYEDIHFNSRIDYIFVNDFFVDKLARSWVSYTPAALAVWGGDDHKPLLGIFNMNPELADLRPPLTPYDLQGEVLSDTQISFSWASNNESDFVGYQVYRDDILMQETTDTFYVDTGLTSGVIYKYSVISEDNSTNVSYHSAPMYINTDYGILTTPSSPILLGTAGPVQSILNWTVEDDGGFDVEKYKIYRATENSIADNNFIFQTETTETSWVDTHAWAGKKWYYYVVAYNKLGSGNDSAIIEVTPTEATDIPVETSDEEDSPIIYSSVIIALFSVAVLLPIQRKKYFNSKR